MMDWFDDAGMSEMGWIQAPTIEHDPFEKPEHIFEGFGVPDINGDGRSDYDDMMILAREMLLETMGDQDDSYSNTSTTIKPSKTGDVDVIITDRETGAHAHANWDQSTGTADVFIYR